MAEKKINDKGINIFVDQSIDTYKEVPMLEMIFEKFRKNILHTIQRLISRNITLEINNIGSIKFKNYTDDIRDIYITGILKSNTLKNYALISVEHHLLIILISNLLGEKEISKLSSQKKELTYIEQEMARQFLENIIMQCNNAFKDIYDIDFKLNKLETNSHFLTVVNSEAMVMQVTYEISLDKVQGKIKLLLPYKTLNPLKDKLENYKEINDHPNSGDWSKNLKKAINNINLDVKAVIRSVSSIHEVMNFKTGSVFTLDRTEDEDVEILVNGMKICEGKLGKQNNRVAVHISQLNDKIIKT